MKVRTGNLCFSLCLLVFTICTAHTFGQNSATKDTMFKAPYVDIDEWRDTPVRHRYVHGGFTGRIWYTDHANHGDYVVPGDPGHLVSYLGVLQQALRDLSASVEKGIAPPANTNYKVTDGQVVLPSNAAERKGIQATVMVKANGNESIVSAENKPVVFTAVIDLPPNTGSIVHAAWDFENTGKFSVEEKFIGGNKTGSHVTLKNTYTFSKPGTYFPTLRVAFQRKGDAKTRYTLIKNLGRVRVVVKKDK